MSQEPAFMQSICVLVPCMEPQYTLHPNCAVGFHKAYCSYLARRVYPGDLMLKRKGVGTFQNWVYARSFWALTFPFSCFCLGWQRQGLEAGITNPAPSQLLFASVLHLFQSGPLKMKMHFVPHRSCNLFLSKSLSKKDSSVILIWQKGSWRQRKKNGCLKILTAFTLQSEHGNVC